MKTDTKQIVTLDQIEVKNLPELQGWKDKQNQIVKENPFVTVEDNKTYQEAKKHRTILLTARTDVQKQDKLIASKLKEIRTQAGNVRDELISITQPHEDKQQDEVKRYETEKEAERKEKERLEQERKEAIQYGINTFYRDWKSKISKITFGQIGDLEIEAAIEEYSKKDLEEFNLDFDEKVNLLNDQFDERVTYLQEQEEFKKQRERLAEERKEFESQKEKEDEARKVREQAESEKLRKERAEFEAERQKVADEEAAKLAKEAEEKKRKEIEAKRLKSLQPDKEKLINFIEGIKLTEDSPKLKDKSMIDFLEKTINDIELWKNASIDEINQIK